MDDSELDMLDWEAFDYLLLYFYEAPHRPWPPADVHQGHANDHVTQPV